MTRNLIDGVLQMGVRAAVIHGKDRSGVAERAEVLCRAITPDLNDPFNVSLLTDGDVDAGDGRLEDALSALSMMGGRRLVRVRLSADKAATDKAFSEADVVSKIQLHYPRSHPSPLEPCGSIADFDRATGKLTVYMTTQAPHIIRAAVALVAELPEHMIRIVSPDLGGGFGNKVPVYPGYVVSILASILTERPVKWIEDKSGNLISTGFGRDVYLQGEMALRKDGRILGVRMHTISDHGAFFADAQPSKFKIGLMHSAFACYDIPAAHLTATGMYTNKAPGGVAYRCSFRVTEAMFFQERMIQAAADDLGMDQAEFRRVNLVKDDMFPYRTAFGFLTDSGQYGKCLDVALDAIGYGTFKQEQEEARTRSMPATSSVTGCSTCRRVLTSRNEMVPSAPTRNSQVPAPTYLASRRMALLEAYSSSICAWLRNGAGASSTSF